MEIFKNNHPYHEAYVVLLQKRPTNGFQTGRLHIHRSNHVANLIVQLVMDKTMHWCALYL